MNIYNYVNEEVDFLYIEESSLRNGVTALFSSMKGAGDKVSVELQERIKEWKRKYTDSRSPDRKDVLNNIGKMKAAALELINKTKGSAQSQASSALTQFDKYK